MVSALEEVLSVGPTEETHVGACGHPGRRQELPGETPAGGEGAGEAWPEAGVAEVGVRGPSPPGVPVSLTPGIGCPAEARGGETPLGPVSDRVSSVRSE